MMTSSAHSNRLSSIMEEDSNSNSNGNNKNPLQEALDAIRTLADEGDFSDSELMNEEDESSDKVRKVSYDRDMDSRIIDDGDDDDEDEDDEDEESAYENVDGDNQIFRAIRAKESPIRTNESPERRMPSMERVSPQRPTSLYEQRRPSVENPPPRRPVSHYDFVEKHSPNAAFSPYEPRRTSAERDSPQRTSPRRDSAERESPQRTASLYEPRRASLERDSPSRSISLKDRLFSRNIEREEEPDKQERRRSGSLDVVRESVEEDLIEEESNKENILNKVEKAKTPVQQDENNKSGSDGRFGGGDNIRKPVVEEPCVVRHHYMLGDQDEDEEEEDYDGKQEQPDPTIATRRSQPTPKALDLPKPSTYDDRPLPTSSNSNNSNVAMVTPTINVTSEPALPATNSGGSVSGYNLDKIIEPSPEATGREFLLPCPTCGRTFNRDSLERHIKICEKVNANKKHHPSPSPKNVTSIGSPGSARRSFRKKKSSNIEEEFKECPYCHRKFGPKPYDRHVEFCEGKARRLQTSPTKDLLALAKLHARTHYRPKTPTRKDERKISLGTCDSPLPPSVLGDMEYQSHFGNGGNSRGNSVSRSESRNSHVTVTLGGRRSSQERRISNISSLVTDDHTKETDSTKFIRAATGRGSIKRGPAPTKASQLREIAKQEKLKKAAAEGGIGENGHQPLMMSSSMSPVTTSNSIGNSPFVRTGSLRASRTPNTANAKSKIDNRTPTSFRSRNASPSGLGRYSMSNSYHGGYGSTPNTSSSPYSSPMYSHSFQPVVRPSVVRPGPSPPTSSSTSSYISRRHEPEGIESSYSTSTPKSSSLLHRGPSPSMAGTYDHSAEYDPYQSAARQMQELLFGPGGDPSSKPDNNTSSDLLKPSSNSAFSKYIPSTTDINTKMNSSITSSGDSSHNNNSSSSNKRGSVGVVSPFNSSATLGGGSNTSARSSSGLGGGPKSPKVARFCHECGNPFALPDIRFCCECGVKRLCC